MTTDEGYLYQQLAGSLGRAIDEGTLRPGERVPSVRVLCRQHKVSLSTAVAALLDLENRGLVEARPRSGFYVRSRITADMQELTQHRLKPSVTKVGVSHLCESIFDAVGRPDVVHLGAAVPADSLIPWRKINRIIAVESRRLGAKACAYDMPPGAAALRREIARRYVSAGCPMSADEIVTACGCMEGLNMALRAVCKPGDVVAIESPIYFGILQLMEEMGLRVVEVASDPRTGLNVDALASVLRRHRVAACVAVPQFNNPLGSLVPEENKQAIVSMLGRRQIPLVEDDIYGELYFGSSRPRPAKSFDKNGLVILCGSVSKSLAPGLRVGWVAAGRYAERIKRLRMCSTVSSAMAMEAATAAFLQGGGYDHHLRGLRRALRDQVSAISERVAACFPEGTRMSNPQGGLVLWVELPKGVDATAIHDEAARENVSFAPGVMFSARGGYRNFLRLNCGEPMSPQIERGIALIGHLAKKKLRVR